MDIKKRIRASFDENALQFRNEVFRKKSTQNLHFFRQFSKTYREIEAFGGKQTNDSKKDTLTKYKKTYTRKF